ncbi:Na+-transporting NADH:ubiquinone oxidoreductase subunit B [Draconibacterium orientale]|uniref:Na(+)-translocating NADH-quinone reductase subunit B n=1 Tax=Draconibacterium orientale TaxID=1168034 RepID=X5DLE5_9BACT|nr:NADH:ubiquinone reductase (Na(+)-transporting) subunit B [Draconibacterium orientale]AHW61362.1 Na(+)-translocating NADH-quinone reductase subunit B [Draconibacterium orientale]SET90612.1 Na+-transporting NADH:ubiquinone oxidoreductase subunit B [Draconibacterium orientale]
MKFIKNFFERTEPLVQKGAKYHWLNSVHDGFFTFLYTPKTTSKTGTHIHDYIDLKRTMSIVVLSVVPALLFGMYNVGVQHFKAIGELASTGFFDIFLFGLIKVLPIVIVSYAVGLGIEFVFAQLRGHEIQEGFLVSGMLIPLIMPVNTPLWMIAVATAFAVILGKEVFGGTGMNIWNPALVARAFLFFAYPAQMSGDSVWIALKDTDKVVDGFSGATPMADAAAGHLNYSVADAFFGFIPGSIGETSTLAILIGAVLLIITGIGSWKIMVSTIAGGAVMGLILNAFSGSAGLSPEVATYFSMPFWHHLILGGFMFGAIFMATDPVSAAQTEKGKWIYGFLIGILAIIFRVINPAFPEGMMLAILLMNTFAPLIDHYVVAGHVKRRVKRAKVSA